MYLPFIIACSRQKKLLISQNKMLTDTDHEWTSIGKFNLACRNWGGGAKSYANQIALILGQNSQYILSS